ncbi:hypothetical protein C9302_17625, partial [Escherichia coli]
MNRIYRVIWNCTLQVFQACSELTRRAGKTLMNPLMILVKIIKLRWIHILSYDQMV